MLFFSCSKSLLSWLREDFSDSICLIILFSSILSCPSPSFSDCSLTSASRRAISSDFILLISNSSSALWSSDLESVSATWDFSCSITSLSNIARDNCSLRVTISSLSDDCLVSSCSMTCVMRCTSFPSRSLSRSKSSLSSSKLSRCLWSSLFAAWSFSISAVMLSSCSFIEWRIFSKFCFSVAKTSECDLKRSRSWLASETFWRLETKKKGCHGFKQRITTKKSKENHETTFATGRKSEIPASSKLLADWITG